MMTVPVGWCDIGHRQWLGGQQESAIESVLVMLRRLADEEQRGQTPPEALLPGLQQVAYYIFLRGDPLGAARFLEMARTRRPDHPDILRNLGVCLSRGGLLEESVAVMERLRAVEPDDAVCFDSLCNSLALLGRLDEARHAGTRALMLKDQSTTALRPPPDWTGIPTGDPVDWLQRTGRYRRVLSYSLWGRQPRYLRGALDNALAAPMLYPGWVVRFHVDGTVPTELCSALISLGAEVCRMPDGQSLRERLTWRFQVSNDTSVARFLVRDVDSLISPREVAAVEAWLTSGRWFHVMRDWWTHTDPILAGLWGGVGGVLPDLQALLKVYRPPALETPNIDQWFLRDAVWPLIRAHALVHDRCFDSHGAQPWPTPEPPAPDHVGQDEHAVRASAQAERLAGWLPRLACLTA